MHPWLYLLKALLPMLIAVVRGLWALHQNLDRRAPDEIQRQDRQTELQHQADVNMAREERTELTRW
jgi:hypothetical protein